MKHALGLVWQFLYYGLWETKDKSDTFALLAILSVLGSAIYHVARWLLGGLS